MGNRVGVIFHENWDNFSPLLYSHYGADTMSYSLKTFIKDYKTKHPEKTSGHLYDASHMMANFIKFLDEDIHMRIDNLSDVAYDSIQHSHIYDNCFEGGCMLVDVSFGNYGNTTVS